MLLESPDDDEEKEERSKGLDDDGHASSIIVVSFWLRLDALLTPFSSNSLVSFYSFTERLNVCCRHHAGRNHHRPRQLREEADVLVRGASREALSTRGKTCL